MQSGDVAVTSLKLECSGDCNALTVICETKYFVPSAKRCIARIDIITTPNNDFVDPNGSTLENWDGAFGTACGI